MLYAPRARFHKTFHYGLNTANNQQLDILPSSKSDGAIYARNQNELDVVDNNYWVPRSSSLNAMVSMHVEFSEDEEKVLDEEFGEANVINREDNDEDKGAARIRDPPTRKSQLKEQKCNTLKSNNTKVPTAGLRSRRKLRNATPDIEVDVV